MNISLLIELLLLSLLLLILLEIYVIILNQQRDIMQHNINIALHYAKGDQYWNWLKRWLSWLLLLQNEWINAISIYMLFFIILDSFFIISFLEFYFLSIWTAFTEPIRYAMNKNLEFISLFILNALSKDYKLLPTRLHAAFPAFTVSYLLSKADY